MKYGLKTPRVLSINFSDNLESKLTTYWTWSQIFYAMTTFYFLNADRGRESWLKINFFLFMGSALVFDSRLCFLICNSQRAVSQNLVHYFDTHTHHLNISFQYHCQELSSSDALRIHKVKCNAAGSNPGPFADLDFPAHHVIFPWQLIMQLCSGSVV